MSISIEKLINAFSLTPDPNGTIRAKTPEFRASYANVFEPRMTPSKELKYSISMIFLKENKAQLKDVAQAIVNAAAKKFGADHKKWPKNLKCPIRDGDEEREGKEYKDSFFMNAGNKNPPGIIDRSGKALTDKEEFYSGCFARASISFFPYDQAGNKGVGAGLNNLMFIKEGDRLDNVVAPEDDFADDIEQPKVGSEETTQETSTENNDVF